MNKQDYLRKKGLLPKEEFGKIYIVTSTKEDVILREYDIWNVYPGGKTYYSDSVRIFDRYNYKIGEIFIYQDTKSGEEHGFGTGFGDLWGWSNFAFLNKEDAELKLDLEKIRIKNYRNVTLTEDFITPTA